MGFRAMSPTWRGVHQHIGDKRRRWHLATGPKNNSVHSTRSCIA